MWDDPGRRERTRGTSDHGHGTAVTGRGYRHGVATTTRRGRPPRSEAERAEQRARILAAAMDSIRARGPEVSIDDLAADSGVSKPVLYSHFGDKKGLADAIAVDIADSVTSATAAALTARPGQVDLAAALESIVGGIVDLVEGEPDIYAFLARSIRSGEGGFFDNALVEVVRERGGMLASLASPGIDADLLRLLVDAVFGFLFFAVESWQLTRNPPRDELVAILARVVLSGFAAASPAGAQAGRNTMSTGRAASGSAQRRSDT
jgi:AcrR family transcriptional regulator